MKLKEFNQRIKSYAKVTNTKLDNVELDILGIQIDANKKNKLIIKIIK